MYEDYAQAFWIVCFEDFDHEFDRAVILTSSSAASNIFSMWTVYHVCH